MIITFSTIVLAFELKLKFQWRGGGLDGRSQTRGQDRERERERERIKDEKKNKKD